MQAKLGAELEAHERHVGPTRAAHSSAQARETELEGQDPETATSGASGEREA